MSLLKSPSKTILLVRSKLLTNCVILSSTILRVTFGGIYTDAVSCNFWSKHVSGQRGERNVMQCCNFFPKCFTDWCSVGVLTCLHSSFSTWRGTLTQFSFSTFTGSNWYFRTEIMWRLWCDLTCLGTSLHSSDWTSLGMSLHCWASTWAISLVINIIIIIINIIIIIINIIIILIVQSY